MKDCIFCKIINKEIPAEIVFENEHLIAFKDINHQAPIHLLLIPKKHISTILELEKEDEILMGKIMSQISVLAKQESIDKNGFRVVINCGINAGQAVFHLHFHLLGGRKFIWPPG